MRGDRNLYMILGTLLTLALIPVTAAVAGSGVIKGEVIRVEERVQTRNGGEFDELTVRTRNGEEMRLRLGQAGSCPNCFQVGEQVKAKVGPGGAQDGAFPVQSVQRRQGGTVNFRDASGNQVQDRDRIRAYDSSGAGGKGSVNSRQRDRVHEPGSGGCVGGGGRQGGARQGAGSSGGRRGGGGGRG